MIETDGTYHCYEVQENVEANNNGIVTVYIYRLTLNGVSSTKIRFAPLANVYAQELKQKRLSL